MQMLLMYWIDKERNAVRLLLTDHLDWIGKAENTLSEYDHSFSFLLRSVYISIIKQESLFMKLQIAKNKTYYSHNP